MFEKFIKSQFYIRKSNNLRKLGFSFENEPLEEYKKIQSMLYTLYHIENHSQITIKEHFDIPSGKTIDTIFKLFSIESRTLSAASKLAYEQGRLEPVSLDCFKSTFHNTWFGESVFLRSSYELEYAKLLDECKIFYYVEPFRIKYFDDEKQTFRIAIPDFYLPKSKTLVEVKSSYWLDEKNMNSKKNAYNKMGYTLDLYLDHRLIKNW